MSEEIRAADALLTANAELRARAEQAEALARTLQAQRDAAEARVAALMRAITPLLGAWGAEDSYDDETEALFDVVASLDDAGAALLAELEAARSQAHVRDSLAEAFEAGEHQGVCRAIIILAIAKAHAADPAAQAALAACLQILVPE